MIDVLLGSEYATRFMKKDKRSMMVILYSFTWFYELQPAYSHM